MLLCQIIFLVGLGLAEEQVVVLEFPIAEKEIQEIISLLSEDVTSEPSSFLKNFQNLSKLRSSLHKVKLFSEDFHVFLLQREN